MKIVEFPIAGLVRGAAATLVAVALSACGTVGPASPGPQLAVSHNDPEGPKEIADPLERQNRAVFNANQKFNHAVIYRVAKVYNEKVPQKVRDRIDAFNTNLSEPLVFANDVLQLRFKAAGTTLGRFAMNSTLGVGGLFDVAAKKDLLHQSGDFGQTLYVWGVRRSPYVVLPVLGPTNLRDAIGGGVEIAAQIPAGGLLPLQYASVVNSVGAVSVVSTPLSNLSKAQDLKALEEGSLDFYSLLRSVTDQKRQAELREALETSALTARRARADPNATEPVTEVAPPPAFVEKPRPIGPGAVRRGATADGRRTPPIVR